MIHVGYNVVHQKTSIHEQSLVITGFLKLLQPLQDIPTNGLVGFTGLKRALQDW